MKAALANGKMKIDSGDGGRVCDQTVAFPANQRRFFSSSDQQVSVQFDPIHKYLEVIRVLPANDHNSIALDMAPASLI
jgi:hypothetical protein